MSRGFELIDVCHSIEDGMITYKGLPAPVIMTVWFWKFMPCPPASRRDNARSTSKRSRFGELSSTRRGKHRALLEVVKLVRLSPGQQPALALD